MKIYIAGKWEEKNRLKIVKDRVPQKHSVLSSWLEEDEKNGDYWSVTQDKIIECATRDVREIKESKLFILDTWPDNQRGGREVEFGVALASGKETWIVGPRKNFFHHLCDIHFNNWEDILNELRNI